jgi:GH24 family phage-related lysozyme (muramidase)
VGVESVVDIDLTDNQYAALVCLTFNIGVAAFSKSTLLRLLNEGKYDEAQNQFIRWDKDNGKTIPGLHARREREAELFGST